MTSECHYSADGFSMAVPAPVSRIKEHVDKATQMYELDKRLYVDQARARKEIKSNLGPFEIKNEINTLCTLRVLR